MRYHWSSLLFFYLALDYLSRLLFVNHTHTLSLPPSLTFSLSLSFPLFHFHSHCLSLSLSLSVSLSLTLSIFFLILFSRFLSSSRWQLCTMTSLCDLPSGRPRRNTWGMSLPSSRVTETIANCNWSVLRRFLLPLPTVEFKQNNLLNWVRTLYFLYHILIYSIFSSH